MSSPPRPVAVPDSLSVAQPAGLFEQYDLDRTHDEMFDAPGHARPHYHALLDELATVSLDDLRRRQHGNWNWTAATIRCDCFDD